MSVPVFLAGVFGVLLFAEGTWLLLMPRPIGMIVDGGMTLAFGVWFVVTTIANTRYGGEIAQPLSVGATLSAWGFKSICRYGRFSRLSQSPPSIQVADVVRQVVRAVVKARAASEPDIIEFEVPGYLSEQSWKGWLGGGVAVFLGNSGDDVLFVEAGSVSIDIYGGSLVGDDLKASFRLGGLQLKGTITPEAFARFEAWQAGPIARPSLDT